MVLYSPMDSAVHARDHKANTTIVPDTIGKIYRHMHWRVCNAADYELSELEENHCDTHVQGLDAIKQNLRHLANRVVGDLYCIATS